MTLAASQYLTLHEAAKLIPGADAETLKRMHRRGKLTCFRPGKAFLTTAAEVQKAIEACHVAPKVQGSGYAPRAGTTVETSHMSPLGLSSMDLASAALDSALTQLKTKSRSPSKTI